MSVDPDEIFIVERRLSPAPVDRLTVARQRLAQLRIDNPGVVYEMVRDGQVIDERTGLVHEARMAEIGAESQKQG